MCDAGLDGGLGTLLQGQVGGQDLRHVLTDVQLAQVLQVGQAVEHEDAVHQLVSVFHLANGFLVFLFGQLVEAPVFEHAVVHKVLVDGGELVLELRLQVRNDLGIAFHDGLLMIWVGKACSVGRCPKDVRSKLCK